MVTVINQTTAERFWPDGNVLGRRVNIVGADVEIVGVVADTKHLALDEPAPFQSYFARRQAVVPWQIRLVMSIVLRTGGDPLEGESRAGVSGERRRVGRG